LSISNPLRIALIILVGVGLSSAQLSMAAPSPALPSIAGAVVSTDKYPLQQVAFPGGVKGIPDIPYTSSPGFRPVTLDLYLPPASYQNKGPRPFVVYVHGGAWVGGSPRTTGAFANWAQALASIAARGYVVASVNYRLAEEAPFPAAIQDVKDAIRWMHGNARLYNIDKSLGLIWGSSAGGQLAALAATSCGNKELDRPQQKNAPNAVVETNQEAPDASESACVQAAVIWYGVSDFTKLDTMTDANRFLGCQIGAQCDAVRRAASPVTYVNANVPPFLLIHGADDRTVPAAQSQQFYEAIAAQKRQAELLLLPGIDHSFLGKTAEATREASLQAWERTLAFIDKTIGKDKGP
jgi:acetyl esterase/lipase